MKYLLKFNESIAENNLEIIENCFLEYIDSGRCISSPSLFEDQVFLYFEAISLSAVSQMAKRDNSSLKRELWEWTYRFVKEIEDDVRRCESYGFECYFHFFGAFPRAINSTEGQLIMSVCRPGFVDIDELSLDKHRIDDALKHIQQKIEETMTDRDLEIIENCFLEYVDNAQCTIRQGDHTLFLDNAIVVTFPIPEEKNTHFKYRWLDQCISGLFGDIKRCESYGYECRFYFHGTNPTKLNIWVYKKGSKKKYNSSELNYNQAMLYIKSGIESTDPSK